VTSFPAAADTRASNNASRLLNCKSLLPPTHPSHPSPTATFQPTAAPARPPLAITDGRHRRALLSTRHRPRTAVRRSAGCHGRVRQGVGRRGTHRSDRSRPWASLTTMAASGVAAGDTSRRVGSGATVVGSLPRSAILRRPDRATTPQCPSRSYLGIIWFMPVGLRQQAAGKCWKTALAQAGR
jgi:hypothetical protein